ncbi:MAG: hypothetical protein ACK56I_12050, partial [bacterium]
GERGAKKASLDEGVADAAAAVISAVFDAGVAATADVRLVLQLVGGVNDVLDGGGDVGTDGGEAAVEANGGTGGGRSGGAGSGSDGLLLVGGALGGGLLGVVSGPGLGVGLLLLVVG